MTLRRLVLLVVTLGLAAQLGARTLLADAGPVFSHGGLVSDVPPVLLVLGLLAMAVAGDLVSVPVRRGEETEELTLYEAAVVVAVLLLPARDALWVPVAALALTAVVQRRAPLKAFFNLANHAMATALLVVRRARCSPGRATASTGAASWHCCSGCSPSARPTSSR